MTSISATPGSYLSPLQTLQDQLQSEVNSGAISASDQGALSSALNDISASLQNGGPAGDSTNGTASAPGDLKSKIDNLIANEVSSGKLTSDQATELQGVFKSAFAGNAQGNAQGPEGAGHAHHGHHGGGMAVRPRPTAAPAPPTTFCSNSCSRCRLRCPLRHRRPMAQPASPIRPTAARHSRRC